MKKISWKKIRSRILCLLGLETPKEVDCDYFLLKVHKKRELYASLIERSGAKSIEELFEISAALFATIIDLELREGSVDLDEPNGVDRQKLDLLGHINGDADSWND